MPSLEQRDELCLTIQTWEDDHKAVGDAVEASVGACLIALPMESGQRSCVPDFTKETCSGLHSQDPSCLTLSLSITGSEKSQGHGAVCSDNHL